MPFTNAFLALGLAALLCAGGPAARAGTSAPAQTTDANLGEAIKVVKEFHAALARGDATAAAALLDDSAIIYEEGEAELTKAEYQAHHLPADAAFSSVISESVVRRDGAAQHDFAWVATQGRMSGHYQGRDIDRLTTETMVLRRFASGWRIVHIHWSSKAAAAQ